MTYPSVTGVEDGVTAIATSHALDLPSGSVGNLLLAFIGYGETTGSHTFSLAGFTSVVPRGVLGSSPDGYVEVWYRIADGSEGATVTGTTTVGTKVAYQIRRITDYSGVPEAATFFNNASIGLFSLDPPNLSTTFGAGDKLYFALMGYSSASRNIVSYPSGYANGLQTGTVSPASIHIGAAEKQATAGSDDPGAFTLSSDSWQSGTTVAVKGAVSLTADFLGTPTSGTLPLTVDFFDLSSGGTGTIDTWSWTFGDGDTSSVQNPTHTYLTPGTYDVTLTVENDDAQTASVTKLAYVVPGSEYVPPEPGGAIIEIRAAAIDAARWGVALWGTDVWAAAGWVDVTPQSIDAVVRWGSHQPEAGILLETEAGSWIVDTYDPDRLLDPGNTDSPYHADLRAGLPIRIRHRGTIVRQGVAETIAYFYAAKQGGIRVTDNVSILARSSVPSDSIVSDTLRARARDVIAAAGLRVTVEPDPPAGDPALAPKLTGDRSAWRHIADAAQQVLHIPYIDAIGTLKFRPWATPYDRARGVDGTMLIDLGTIVATAGLYSVVSAQQTVGDGDALIERRSTPTPRYGAVAYSRTDATPDADDWADAVLADRSLQTTQWIPGEIYPLTANDVETFATMEGMERFGVEHADVTPPVDITGIVVGGEIRVTAKKDSEARWRFLFEVAQTQTAIPPVTGTGAGTGAAQTASGTGTVGAASYASVVAADAPIHQWRCNDSSGDLNDSVGAWSLDNGTVSSYGVTSLLASDTANKAVSFASGSNTKRDSTNSTMPTSALSIEAWIKPASGAMNNSGIAGCWNAGVGSMLLLGIGSNNELRFYTGNGALVGGTLTNGTTYHVVGTWDGTNRRLYVNGSLTHGPTAGLAVASSPGVGWQISGYGASTSTGFIGTIDEVALYNVALSAARVAAHYAAG